MFQWRILYMPHLVNLHRLSFLNIQIFFQRTGTFRIYDKTSNMLKGGAKIQSFSNLLTTKPTIILFTFTVESTKSLPCHVLQYPPLTLFEVVPNWQALILVQLSSPVILLVPGTLSESEPSGAELFCVLQQHKMFLNVYNMRGNCRNCRDITPAEWDSMPSDPRASRHVSNV